MVSDTAPSQTEEQTLEERAGDAKFFLTIGSGSFIILGIILLVLGLSPHLFPLNIVNTFFVAALGYLLPGLVLFFWGLGKVYRGKDLTFSQVWQARIQRNDVKRTARFLLFVTFFVILLTVPVLLGMSILDIMNNTIQWSLLTFGPIGIYVGVFLISIFGNFTVIFPIPYLFVLLLLALQPGFTLFDGLILGIVAGAGAAIGEITAWLLGRTQTESLEESPTGQQFLKLRTQIEKGYGGIFIFVYAATPLPDDVLLIALGATKYPLWKALIFCFFGKVALTLLITIGAQLPFIQPILINVFGGAQDPIMDTLYLIIGIAIIGLFFVPWGSLLGKLRGNSKELK
jgi:membrane protein YqaA with SNARE-associated domain